MKSLVNFISFQCFLYLWRGKQHDSRSLKKAANRDFRSVDSCLVYPFLLTCVCVSILIKAVMESSGCHSDPLQLSLELFDNCQLVGFLSAEVY